MIGPVTRQVRASDGHDLVGRFFLPDSASAGAVVIALGTVPPPGPDFGDFEYTLTQTT